MTLDLPHGFKRWGSFAEFQAASLVRGRDWRGQTAFQTSLVAQLREPEIAGYCAVCDAESQFAVRGQPEDWRETLNCAKCQLVHRWRASVHMVALLSPITPAGTRYVTEQTTPLYAAMELRWPGLIGSEYLGSDAQPGEIREWYGRSLRHEDVTALSMADASLASVLSFDVLEHVPDYRAALGEFARVLQPDGVLLLTAPFRFNDADTLIRSRIAADGTLEHLLPEVYHGDPLSPKGVLCYQEFGWDLLDELRGVGFSQVEVISCWAPQFGYIGEIMPFIVARRYAPPPPTRWQQLARRVRAWFRA